LLRTSTLSHLSDEELLQLHKESDNEKYVEELFLRYLPLLYGVCLKYLKDSDISRDAVMQLFEDLRYKIAEYDIAEFRPWIYRVVKNHCMQILQKEEHYVADNFVDNTAELKDMMHLLQEMHVSQSILLTDCLNKLPERQRISLTYFFTDKLPYAEIVNKTGYTLKNVKNYIQAGTKNLKICLENNKQ